MNKAELIAAIAEGSQLSKVDAQRALDATIEAITNELTKGGDVTLVGFGTFHVKDRPPRTGRNPSNGKPMEIAGKKVPGFKPGSHLKSAVN